MSADKGLIRAFLKAKADERAEEEAEEVGSGPTLKQMENLALALGFPILTGALRPPYYEESLRNLHGIVQRAASGDEDAGLTLAALKAAFGR